MKTANDVLVDMSNLSLGILVCTISIFVVIYWSIVVSVWAFAPNFSTALLTVIFGKCFLCMSLILRKKQLLQEAETRNYKDFTRNSQEPGEGLGGVNPPEDEVVDAEILTEITAEQSSTDLDPVQAEAEYRSLIAEGVASLKVKDVLAVFPALDYKTLKGIWEAEFTAGNLNRAIRYKADGSVHQCRYSYPPPGENGGVETSTGAKAA